jgi:hypothetical protein
MAEMKTYDILLKSLRHTYRTVNLKWVRGIKATSLAEASAIAIQQNPNLGITPTTVSMGWPTHT